MIKEYKAILNGKPTKRYVFATDETKALVELQAQLAASFGGYDEMKIKDGRITATGNNTIFEGTDIWTIRRLREEN